MVAIFNSTDPGNSDPKPFVHSNGNRFSLQQARTMTALLHYVPREEFNTVRRYPTNTILADYRKETITVASLTRMVNNLENLMTAPNGTSDEVRHAHEVLSRLRNFI